MSFTPTAQVVTTNGTRRWRPTAWVVAADDMASSATRATRTADILQEHAELLQEHADILRERDAILPSGDELLS
jgi:hypothetical protein